MEGEGSVRSESGRPEEGGKRRRRLREGGGRGKEHGSCGGEAGHKRSLALRKNANSELKVEKERDGSSG